MTPTFNTCRLYSQSRGLNSNVDSKPSIWTEALINGDFQVEFLFMTIHSVC